MRTMQHTSFCLRVGLAALMLAAAGAAHAQYAYDIAPIAGRPEGLNNRGQVVGYYYTDTRGQHYQAFLYSDGTTTNLFPDPTTNYEATGINGKGQISAINATTGGLFYDSSTKVKQDIFPSTRANGINQNGDVVGLVSAGDDEGFIYSSSTGKVQRIGKIGGYTNATAINNKGQAAGYFVTGGQGHAFLYSNGSGLQDIGTLPGGVSALATGLNDSGDVVGYSDGITNGTSFGNHAFLYHNGAMTDIGALINPQYASFADGINNAGDIVGEAGNTGFLFHNGQNFDLNNLIDPSLGWNIRTATAINDNGQIIGYGNLGGFIMTPHRSAVPAPGSLLVCGLGGGLLLMLRLRGRKRAMLYELEAYGPANQ